jgi:hypothetical protein
LGMKYRDRIGVRFSERVKTTGRLLIHCGQA